MKVKHLSALAGLAGTALIASPANAAFTGFVIESFDVGVDHLSPDVRAAWIAGGGAGLESYRIYATFDTTGDALQGVFGDQGGTVDARRAFLNVSGTIFNQVEVHHVTGAVIHFNTPFFAGGGAFAGDPERGWDTFVTIGRFAGDTATQFSTGADVQTNNLQSNWDSNLISTGIAWTIVEVGEPPVPAAQAIVGATGRMLVMQLTVSAGSLIQGNFGIQFKDPITGVVSTLHDDIGLGGLSYFEVIPSPGAFALLGLAGLTGVRRRRRH